jgi:hypothetical protein
VHTSDRRCCPAARSTRSSLSAVTLMKCRNNAARHHTVGKRVQVADDINSIHEHGVTKCSEVLKQRLLLRLLPWAGAHVLPRAVTSQVFSVNDADHMKILYRGFVVLF